MPRFTLQKNTRPNTDAHPRSTALTGRLAGACARHPWRVFGAWVVILALALTTMIGFGDRFSTNDAFRTDLESRVADELLTERLYGGETAPLQERVIVSSTTHTVDSAEFRAVVEQVAATLREEADVAAVATYYDSADEHLVSFDRHRTVVVTTLAGERDEALTGSTALLKTIADLENPAPGYNVITLGEASVTDTVAKTAKEGIARGESIGIIVALVVLALAFGAVVAAGLPIVLAIVALLTTVGLSMAASHLFDINMAVVQMIGMIGLAIGIDYTLFIVSRYREEREHGSSVVAAVTRAGETASKAVLFSGLTVVVSLLAMLIVPWNLMTSVLGAIAVVFVSVGMTLTLLPAVLGLLGDRINRGKLPRVGYQRTVDTAQSHTPRGTWATVSRSVMRRPLLSLLASASLLLILGSFTFSLQMGHGNLSNLPQQSDSIRAVRIFEQEFPGANYQPATIVVTADDVTSPEIQRAVDDLLGTLRSDPAFGGATTQVSPQADLLRVDVAMHGNGENDAALNALKRLRDTYIPDAFEMTDAAVRVTGKSAFMLDVIALAQTYLPIIIGAVLVISFLLLLVAFRSLVVPLKAVAMNLLSVFASYGLLVLVFQHGVGADLLGFQQVDRIDSFVLLFLFCILFGLSMDYHVFLLSRIKEQFDLTGDNDLAVTSGLASTGRMITSAAVIMVGVFGGFAAADLANLQQFGFGLAAAVFLDATVVRMVLVPASMKLLGSRNWYLPRWLTWLPEMHIEGAPTTRIATPQTPVSAIEPSIAD